MWTLVAGVKNLTRRTGYPMVREAVLSSANSRHYSATCQPLGRFCTCHWHVNEAGGVRRKEWMHGDAVRLLLSFEMRGFCLCFSAFDETIVPLLSGSLHPSLQSRRLGLAAARSITGSCCSPFPYVFASCRTEHPSQLLATRQAGPSFSNSEVRPLRGSCSSCDDMLLLRVRRARRPRFPFPSNH